MRNKYGIQLYSIRDLTSQNLEEAIKAVAEMGYSYVEFAGFFGYTAEEVRAMLDKYGVEVCSTHTGWQELKPEVLADTIAYHKAIGNKNIVVPGFDRTEATFDEMIEVFNYAAPILKENGIALGYHNHSYEFIPTESGRVFHNELAEKTDVEIQLDTFWVYNAELDPIAEMEKFKTRARSIHLKDGIKSGARVESGAVGKSVGSGNAPVLDVIKKAEELGLIMIVESEGLDPTGREEVKRCIDFLKANG